MIRELNNPRRLMLAAGALALLLMGLIGAGTARAASYGNFTFSGSAEGWTTKKAECNLGLLCSASGGYGAAAGNPAGSLAANANVVLTAAGLFKGEVVEESPPFVAGDGGQGVLNVQRAYTPGGLVELTPALNYSVSLVDKNTAQVQKGISESVSGAAGWASKSGAVSLVAGHTYAVVIESEQSASLIGLSLATSTASFDNVSVSGPGKNPDEQGERGENGENGGNGGNGENGGNGANGLTAAQLEKWLLNSLGNSATLSGNKIQIKGKCPSQVGAACKNTAQGEARKGTPSTSKSTAKIAKGKAKRITLRVKPKMKAKVAKKRKMLFQVSIKAGQVHVTVYKTLKLIHAKK